MKTAPLLILLALTILIGACNSIEAPKDSPKKEAVQLTREQANEHVNHSLPNLVGDSYEGGHWLGSFAIYALSR